MKQIRSLLLLAVLIFILILTVTALGQGTKSAAAASAPQAQQSQQAPAARVVDLKASDGTVLKASYFAAVKPGPGVLLLHQGNRQRKVWDDLAGQLAAAGINTLTLDMRGFGESGGTPHDKLTPEERAQVRERRRGDIDTAWQYLVSQPSVQGDVIGVGGAGYYGVNNSIQTARRHSAEVKSLVLLSGQTDLAGRHFVRQASQLPGLFVVADDDEYPPTEEVMEWLYGISSNPGKKFVHYAGEMAPWLGNEDEYEAPVPGGHGTDMFNVHPELSGIIVDWYVTTLIKTPGQAPADNSSAAGLLSVPILDQIEMPGGAAQVAQQLTEARRRDPKAQLWPWVVVNVMGYDHLQAGETKSALEILKLNVTAYPESADANDSLGDAYLADGQKDLARQYAEKALTLLASDTKDSEARRNLIRDSAQQKLKQLAASAPQEQQSQQPPPTIASTVDREISTIEKQIVEAAEAMPEDKFNFSPESLNIPGSDYKGVRTFALEVKHVAASNYFLWSALTGDKLPEDFKGGNGPEDLKTKADIVKFLKDSFALGHKAAATLTTQNMLQTAEHSKSPRLYLATFAVAHAFDHYGQIVEYLRMNGIVPPASRGPSD